MGAYDLDTLLHPSQAFAHPNDVVGDPDLTLNEKRAILASWASDACAVEAAPALRAGRAGSPVQFDDIMEALRTLDRMPDRVSDVDRRRARRRALFDRGRGGHEQGSPLY